MKIVITGCQGFLGSSFAHHALRKGHEVLGITRSEPAHPSLGTIVRPCELDGLEFIDLLSQFRPDLVVHAAGSASVASSFHEPRADFRMAVDTWGALLDAVRRSNVRPLVLFPSSAAVYGNPAQLPVSERDALQPISPYGFHKTICEQLAQEYCRCFGLDIVAARLFSTVGPRQRRLLVWELFRRTQEETQYLTIQGTGDETRDFLHIDDVSEYFLGLMECRSPGFHAINIGSGTSISVRDIAEHVLGAMGAPHHILALNKTLPGDPHHWRADVSMLRCLVSHQPRPIRETIEDCVRQWLLDGATLADRSIEYVERIKS